MLTIAWDVDDVLNNLMSEWLEQEWLPTHSNCHASYQDLRTNPPLHAIGSGLDEYLNSLDHFRQTRYLSSLEPLPEARQWFETYGSGFRHMALTAVPLHCASISAAWVIRHFGAWIRSFHFVPSPRPGDAAPIYDRTKQEFLGNMGMPAVLVDDSPGNVEAARQAGLRAILIARPWNQGKNTLAGAFRELETL